MSAKSLRHHPFLSTDLRQGTEVMSRRFDPASAQEKVQMTAELCTALSDLLGLSLLLPDKKEKQDPAEGEREDSRGLPGHLLSVTIAGGCREHQEREDFRGLPGHLPEERQHPPLFPLEEGRRFSLEEGCCWVSLLGRLARGVFATIHDPAYPFARPETLALIEALASDRRHALTSLIQDAAEILFVPRRERTEYVTHRLASPPYSISRLLLEYALLARFLDRLITTLNKTFCATQCDRPPVGCCTVLGYDLGLVPQRLLTLQQLEARRNGWKEPPDPDRYKCRYHTPTGCALNLFKSPACVGYLCPGIEKDLEQRYAPAPLAAFHKALCAFRHCDLDRSHIFEVMNQLIRLGLALTQQDNALS